MEMKMRNGKSGVEAKGPRLLAKSKSLKLASHARYKKVGIARWAVETGSGRVRKKG